VTGQGSNKVSTDFVALTAYSAVTRTGIACCKALFKNKWKFSIATAFGLLFFIYTGFGLSERSIDGLRFIGKYSAYLYIFIISFYVFSSRIVATNINNQNASRIVFDSSTFCNSIIATYIAASLLPLTLPEFKLGLLFSPPSLNFSDIFSQPATPANETTTKVTRYLSLLLIAPFLLSLGNQKRRPIKVAAILILLSYIQYVSSAYLSRSSILANLVVYVIYIVIQYPEKRRSIALFILGITPIIGLAAAWYLAFRMGTHASQSIKDLAWVMFDIETNFPRDAGIPLYESNQHGNIGDYLIWIFTIPIPKAFFGQFIDYNINYEITYVLTGYRPSESGFSVPLTGTLFAAIYSLGELFWIEPIITGALAGIATKTASQYKHPSLLLGYILITCSYIYNRAGVGGFAPPIYNSFLWLILLWEPMINLASKIKTPHTKFSPNRPKNQLP